MPLNALNRRILALAIPSIVANITTPLLGLVDTAIVGHMGSAVFIAAIALGGSVFNLLYWCFGFLRAGTSGMTAQGYGAKDTSEIMAILYRGLMVALVVGALMIALSPLIADATLDFMGASGADRDYADLYVMVAIWGAPAMLATYVFAGWFIGMQDTRSPMVMSITINVVNIALSLTLVYVCRWGVAGLAAGTMLAQWVGVLVAATLCVRKCRTAFGGLTLRPQWSEILKWGDGYRKFFSVNIDIFLRTLCLIAVTMLFTRMGAMQGTVMLAVNALLMQLFMLVSYFLDGFAYAGEAMVGNAVGARRGDEVRRCIKALMGWGVSMALMFTVIYAACGELILQLLSSDVDVIASAKEYVWWAVTLPLAGFGAFVWDGIFIGATMTRRMLMAMIASMIVFFALLALLFPSMGNHGVWLAFIMYLITRGLASALLGRKISFVK